MNAPALPGALAPTAFQIIPIAALAPSTTRTQARRRARFTKEELAELAASIKVVGVMQPILARPHPKPSDTIKYEIVAGERRWLAGKIAGLAAIPTVVRDVADADIITLQLTENLQRKTIDQLEEAEGYAELRQERKINADQVADLLGVSRTTVFNRLKLLDLVPAAKEQLDAGKLSPSVALLIARLPDPAMQAKATKGCMGIQTAHGNFEYYGDNGVPLTHEQAEKYINEEFTTRLEGSAAISKAKAEGTAIIAGKDAEAIWKNSYGGPTGYVELGESYWSGNKRMPYSKTLGDNPAGVVLIQNPRTGEAAKCLPRDRAIAIFKEKKATLPNELQPRDTGRYVAPVKNAAAAARDRASAAKLAEKQRLEAEIRIAVFKAMRARYPTKLGKPELLEALDLMSDGVPYNQDRELAPPPKSLDKCTERQLVHEVLDSIYCLDDQGECAGSEKEFTAAAKRYGVNVAKITKDLTAAAAAKRKDQADTANVKAKLAKASPLVKAKGKKK
jgi:ParB/RepB/Spo0J family partition protein